MFDSMGYLLVGAEVVPPVGEPRRTDADGRFTAELFEHQASDLLVRAEGRRAQWRRTTATGPDPLFVRLEPSAPWDAMPAPPPPAPPLRAEGLVRSADGELLADAYVHVVGSDCWGRSDEFGRYELPLPTTSVALAAVHAGDVTEGGGFASRPAVFVSPRDRGIVPAPEIQVERGGSIRGMVRDARGQPVASLPVEVRGDGFTRRVETGPGGVFVLRGLLPGRYDVEPFARRGALASPVSVDVDRDVVPCDLQLEATQPRTLRVLDPSGVGLAGVWVATSLHGLRRAVAQADGDGEVQVPVTDDSAFDVRTADGFARCEVRAFDPGAEPATLVVAAP